MKTILSVADFATMFNIVDDKIKNYETIPINPFCKDEQERQIEIKRHKEWLKKNLEYKNLKHIKETLQNLNIEIECPDIEIKGD